MCGLTLLYKYTSLNDTDLEKISISNKEMHYRGPDASSTWNDSKVAMGHVRLSILGTENGDQPFFNQDKTITLICNGEIYNYLQLRKSLKEKGYIFKTNSDCEVILYLYEEYGEDAVNYLRGMFAFILWDSKNKKVFGARDHNGQKPLYYAYVDDGIVFSSELKVIRKLFLCQFELDIGHIDRICTYTYSGSKENTYINEIKKIGPGEYFLIDNNRMIKKNYWKKSGFKKFTGTREESKKEIVHLLRESVHLHMQSEVPIAILLSGGVDSSAVATFAKECREEVHAITVGYKGSNSHHDEREVAQRLCKDLGINWYNIELDPRDYKSYIHEFKDLIDEPNGDIASFAQWGIYKKAKELDFKVLLSGNGGDELFYGYPIHNKRAMALEFENQLKSFFPLTSKKIPRLCSFLIKNWSGLYSFFTQHNYLMKASPFNSTDIGLIHYQSEESFRNPRDTELEQIYQFLFSVWLPNNCYHLADKLGMGQSLEVRSPFADHKLVEFVASLPIGFNFDEKLPKKLLREALEGILPDYILNAPKRGFTPPYKFVQEGLDSMEVKYLVDRKANMATIMSDYYLTSTSHKAKNIIGL